MRQELQENFEALAKQMHGLENQARRATKKGLGAITKDQREIEDSHQFSSNSLVSLESGSPSRSTGAISASRSGDAAAPSSDRPGIPIPSVTNSASSSSTLVTVEASSLQKLPGSIQRVVFDAPDSANHSVLASGSAGSFGDIGDEGNDEEDDDKFFDAPEGSPESVSNAFAITTSKKHTRTPSSVSVNEAQLAMWSKNDLKVEKNLPTITVGNKTCVSDNKQEEGENGRKEWVEKNARAFAHSNRMFHSSCVSFHKWSSATRKHTHTPQVVSEDLIPVSMETCLSLPH